MCGNKNILLEQNKKKIHENSSPVFDRTVHLYEQARKLYCKHHPRVGFSREVTDKVTRERGTK